MTEDERARKDGICGITHVGPTGIEWICIKPVHSTVTFRKSSDRTHRRGDPIYPSGGATDQHYCVNRWPNRKGADGFSTEANP